MPMFTLHRNHVLRTTKGHSIGFVKGQPVWVPPMCVPDAVAIGAVAVDEPVDVLGEEKAAPVPLTPEERQKKLFDAFETMLVRNERTDFTASGLPSERRLSEIVGFDVPRRERDTTWQTYTQLKAEVA